uniref:Uncharacterized protein n=1 Tax=Marseillevirus LCMAC101 TaxID=2506602 RepID=A0A481YQZ0_9VIRU|nr:MAG: hypothetical protein LCMAC101_02170 [Marseillevirus LCMAC101]
MGINQTKLDIPFGEVFEVYSNIDSETSTEDSEKYMQNLAKSFKLNVNSYSSGRNHIDKSNYEEEIDGTVELIDIYLSESKQYSFRGQDLQNIDSKRIIDEILQIKKNVDTILKDGINLNFLGHRQQEKTFQCTFVSFSVNKKGLIEYLTCHFTIQEYQLRYFLQDMYSAYFNNRICFEEDPKPLKFCEKYLENLKEQNISESAIENYYQIV